MSHIIRGFCEKKLTQCRARPDFFLIVTLLLSLVCNFVQYQFFSSSCASCSSFSSNNSAEALSAVVAARSPDRAALRNANYFSYHQASKPSTTSHKEAVASAIEKRVFFKKEDRIPSLLQFAVVKFPAGSSVPFHIHDTATEVFVVAEGEAVFELGPISGGNTDQQREQNLKKSNNTTGSSPPSGETGVEEEEQRQQQQESDGLGDIQRFTLAQNDALTILPYTWHKLSNPSKTNDLVMYYATLSY